MPLLQYKAGVRSGLQFRIRDLLEPLEYGVFRFYTFAFSTLEKPCDSDFNVFIMGLVIIDPFSFGGTGYGLASRLVEGYIQRDLHSSVEQVFIKRAIEIVHRLEGDFRISAFTLVQV